MQTEDRSVGRRFGSGGGAGDERRGAQPGGRRAPVSGPQRAGTGQDGQDGRAGRTGRGTLRRTLLLGGALAGLLTASLQAGCAGKQVYRDAPAAETAILPLKSVRLYESGVGYFERSGGIGSDVTALPVPSGHLDDALKTLVILASGAAGKKDAQVLGLEFPSSVSRGMGLALAGLPAGSGSETPGPISYKDLLTSLKGAAVEVRSGQQTLSGRLIDVLPAPPPVKRGKSDSDGETGTGLAPADGLLLLLLSDRGELHRIPSELLTAVRPLDPSFTTRLRTALDANTHTGAQSQRLLRLLSRDTGPVTLGYVAETPLWRVTYRLVLDAHGKGGVLQGWALIHNDTDEDWKQVRVHLVNGRPDSFLFPLAAPRYARRTLVTPETRLSTVPQLLGKTPDGMWGDFADEEGESVGLGSFGTVGYGSGGGGVGTSHGRGSVSGRAAASPELESSLLSVGNLANLAQSTGVEAGALFTYALGETLELRAHGSALVPFLQESIEVEAITWLDAEGGSPRTGIRFQNSTRQTLPAGPISVFENGGLAGETALERLKPGERRFLQYGSDLDVELTPARTQSRDELQRATFDGSRLVRHFLRKRDVAYRVVNRSGTPRSLYLTLPIGANAQVQGADRLDFDAASKHPIAVFELPPQSQVERPVSTIEGLEQGQALNTLTPERLTELSQATALPAAERAALTEAIARQREAEETTKEIAKAKTEIQKTETELTRLRQHLSALGKDAGGSQNPIVQRVIAAEDRLTAAQKRQEGLDAELEKRHDALRKVLEKLPKKADRK